MDTLKELQLNMSSLDVLVYDKQCNFLQNEDKDNLIFYNRDYGEEISMSEVFDWYYNQYSPVSVDLIEFEELLNKVLWGYLEYAGKL